MKQLFLILFVMCTLFACSNEEDFTPDIDNLQETWTLVKMMGQISNSAETGQDMEWQESYLLNSDGSFIKQRERDGIDYEASGSFTFVDYGDERFLELTYDNNSDIIGSCQQNQTESLLLKSDELLVGTWTACDGPGLEYEKN